MIAIGGYAFCVERLVPGVGVVERQNEQRWSGRRAAEKHARTVCASLRGKRARTSVIRLVEIYRAHNVRAEFPAGAWRQNTTGRVVRV